MASQAFLSAEATAASSVTVAGSGSAHSPFNLRSTTSTSTASTSRVSRRGGRLSSSVRPSHDGQDQWGGASQRVVLGGRRVVKTGAGGGSLLITPEQVYSSTNLSNEFCGRRSTRQVSKLHFGRQKPHNAKHSFNAELALQQVLGAPSSASVPILMHAWRERLVVPEDYVYLLRELGNAGESEKALAIYEWTTKQESLKSEWSKLLSITISALGRLGKVDLAQETFDKAVVAGFGRNVYAYSALVSAYGRSGRFREALEVFELMKTFGCKPNLITYNSVIDACGKGGEDLNKAVEIFKEMQREGVEPDRITFNSLIAVCSRGNMWEEAHKMFQEMQIRGIEQDIFTYNTLVDAVCKAGEMDRAASIVSTMQHKSLQPNVVTYSTLIDGYGKAGRFNEAVSVYNEMKDACIEPDRVSYNTLLYIYAKLGKFDEVHFICKEMERAGWKKDAVTYNALLDAYGKHGRYREASCLFKSMKAEGVIPSLLTYSTLIDTFCKGGLHQEAKLVFEEFKLAGLKPDVVLYSSLIDAFCKTGLVEEATALLEEMTKEGIQPNVVTYNSIIDAYGRQSQVDAPRKLLNTGETIGTIPKYMPEKFVIPAFRNGGVLDPMFICQLNLQDFKGSTVVQSPNVLSMKKSCRDVLVKLFKEMRQLGVKPNVVTFSAILHACSRCASFGEATMLLEELRSFDSRVYGVAHGLLMGSRVQVWGEAKALFDQVSRMDHSTATAFYNALADVLWHFGQREGAQKVVIEAKCRHVWDHAWQHSSQQFCLDLHLMSVGAAQAMLHAWLGDIQRIFLDGYELPKLLSILTGWGKHSKVAGESIVKRAVEARLLEIGAPFQVAKYNEGRFVSTGSIVEGWLEEADTAELLILHDVRVTDQNALISLFSS
eukprot:c27725_g1_i2 orf=572-3229(+)